MKTREIKFRAWNLSDNCWDIPKTKYSIYRGASDLFSRKDEIIRFNRGDIALMQYTGLIDENGREIYEGDIVRFYDKERRIVVNEAVYFSSGAFVANGREEQNDWGRIVGNIYEGEEEEDVPGR